jgi:hypothetical protein
MFVSHRQFASAVGADEIDVPVQLPSGAEIASDEKGGRQDNRRAVFETCAAPGSPRLGRWRSG